MNNDNLHTLATFDLAHLPDLDVAVMGALELFHSAPLPKFDASAYARPLVVGSGNAEATGRIIFENTDALFASESTYEQKLARVSHIENVVVVSASGGKHAPIIAKRARELGKRVALITNNANADALQFVEREHAFVFPKNREPYTYNTSTYMGMILGATGEDPSAIETFIRANTAALSLPDFSAYDKYFLIVPPRFSGIVRMLQVKFIELFGRRMARDVETSEYMKHAVTVVPSDELFISFGEENTTWGDPKRRFHVPLPKNAGYAAMMSVGYYVIAQIQKQNPPYFKEHIAAYTKAVSKVFGQEIQPIVE